MSKTGENYSKILFSVAILVFLIAGFLFFYVVVPTIFPVLPVDKLWLASLVGVFYFSPFLFLFIFASISFLGKEKLNWNVAIIFTVINVLYYAGLLFFFSIVIPSDFEPFRSATLPILVWAVTVYFMAKTGVGKWLKRISEA